MTYDRKEFIAAAVDRGYSYAQAKAYADVIPANRYTDADLEDIGTLMGGSSYSRDYESPEDATLSGRPMRDIYGEGL